MGCKIVKFAHKADSHRKKTTLYMRLLNKKGTVVLTIPFSIKSY
jgi:hypothetical protein